MFTDQPSNPAISNMLLDANGLVSGYSKAEVLHDVSVRVAESEIVSIIGPNGAGKTTLLKTIFGLVKPREGKVVFKGKVVTGLPPYNMLEEGVAYVPQGRSIFPDMTVEENLEMSAYIVKDKQTVSQRLQEVFETFPILDERRKGRAGFLSGGQQQMLALGRAMMLKPHLILLDEPSLGLDPKTVTSVFQKITDIKKATAIILVEQNAYRALEVSDRVYVMDGGMVRREEDSKRLLESGEAADLYFG